MADWFSSLAATALASVDGLVDSLVTQANEAQVGLAEEQRKLQTENDNAKAATLSITSLRMPWETKDEEKTILSQALMEKILSLSVVEGNFTEEPPNAHEVRSKGEWDFAAFVPLAMRLMEVDSNLKWMHAKVSPTMEPEELFWFNYYCRVLYLRASTGIDGQLPQQSSLKYKEADILLTASSSPSSSASTSSSSSEPVNIFGLGHLKKAATSTSNTTSSSSSDSHSQQQDEKGATASASSAAPPPPPSSSSSTPVRSPSPPLSSASSTSTPTPPSAPSHPQHPRNTTTTTEGPALSSEDSDIDMLGDVDLDDLDLGDDDDGNFDSYEDVDGDDVSDDELEAAIARELAAADDE